MARKRSKRRFRDNIWKDNAAGHRKAARKGWSHRRGRRHWSNPGGEAVSIKQPMKALTSAYNLNLAKRGAFVVGGNLLTTLVTDFIAGKVAIIKDNKMANVATTLVVAGLAGAGAKRFMPARADDVLLGGMLAGLTRTLKMVWPSQFGNLSDDLEQDLDDYVDPRQIMAPVGTRGIGYTGDYGSVPQATGAVRLDGLAADQAVADEIASQA